MFHSRTLGFVGAVALFGLVGAAQAQMPSGSTGQAALDEAARKQQYLFVLFHKQDDDATRAMKATLDRALAKQGDRAGSVVVRTDDPHTEKPLIDRWGLSRTPMPIVLAVAPNGAITGGFPLKLTEQDVSSAFVSPGTAGCLKATQARKLVLLCVLPAAETQVPAGVREFAADVSYSPFTEVVMVRPADAAETGFLKSLKIDPATTQTVTAMLLPPGSMVGSFAGPVTKAQLAEKLKAAQSSCCPGGKCGPGGCCPSGGK